MSRREISEKTRQVRDHKNRDKREEADERNAFCATLSPKQRIAGLDQMLGVGVGAKRERARLNKRMAV